MERGPPVRLDIGRTSVAGRSSVTKHQYQQSNLSTLDLQNVQSDPVYEDKPCTGFQLRPKRAFWGRAFVGFGQFAPSLHGTTIFPLPPRQELMYYQVATDGNIDHFDGEPDSTFIDDIKTFMGPVWMHSIHNLKIVIVFCADRNLVFQPIGLTSFR